MPTVCVCPPCHLDAFGFQRGVKCFTLPLGLEILAVDALHSGSAMVVGGWDGMAKGLLLSNDRSPRSSMAVVLLISFIRQWHNI